MAKYDLPGQYLDNPDYQICQHKKCQSVDTGYKTVQSSALRNQYCAVDAQPGIFEACSIGNLHEEHYDLLLRLKLSCLFPTYCVNKVVITGYLNKLWMSLQDLFRISKCKIQT